MRVVVVQRMVVLIQVVIGDALFVDEARVAALHAHVWVVVGFLPTGNTLRIPSITQLKCIMCLAMVVIAQN